MRATAVSRVEVMCATAIVLTASAGLAARGMTHTLSVAVKILYFVVTANR